MCTVQGCSNLVTCLCKPCQYMYLGSLINLAWHNLVIRLCNLANYNTAPSVVQIDLHVWSRLSKGYNLYIVHSSVSFTALYMYRNHVNSGQQDCLYLATTSQQPWDFCMGRMYIHVHGNTAAPLIYMYVR